MRITFRNGIFVAIANFDEKEYLRAAAFQWHPGLNECPKGPASCVACRAGLKQGWWTRRYESAARLSSHADDLAKEALAKHLKAVQMSRATNTDIDIPSPPGLTYLGYQKAGIHYMSEREGTLLGDSPGLGKTIQILGLINHDKTIKSTLIICPASLRINWKRETQKWLVPDERRWLIHVVDEDQAIPDKANFVIVHYNRVTILHKKCDGPCKGEKAPVNCPRCKGTGNGKREPLLCDMCQGRKTMPCPKCNGKAKVPAQNIKIVESLFKRKWDLVAADECHFLKSQEAKRTKAVLGDRQKKKPGLADLGRIRVFMSGTPIPNRPIEIWPIISALAPDEFGNFKAFAMRYCNGHEEMVSKTKKVFVFDGASHLEELQERLRSICMIRRLKEDVLKDLPPKRRQIISLPPSEKAKIMIAEEKELWDQKFGEEIEIVNAAFATAEENNDKNGYNNAVDKLQYLQRVAFMEMASMRKKVAIVKIPQVIEHLEAMFDEGVDKIVCFAHHKEVIEKIHESFPNISAMAYGEVSQEKRQKAVDQFQDKKSSLKLFIGGITAVGVGITLTASSNVVFAELDWTPGNVLQAEDRCIADGQLVQTEERGLVPIEKVKIGEHVMSHTGMWRQVTHVHRRQHWGRMTRVTYDGWSEPLLSTDDHKIYVLKKNRSKPTWTKASFLTRNDFMLMPRPSDGKFIRQRIRNVETFLPDQIKYVNDLTVEEDHSFIVGQAIVHNCHRIGQSGSVLVQHLVLDGSLDARMAQMIVEKQEIADRALDNSTDIAVKGFVTIRPEPAVPDPPPTPVELWKKILAKEALLEIAKRRDAATEGSHGFSKFDAVIGNTLALKRQSFSDREAHLALKLATKYRGQLSKQLLDRLGIEAPPPPKPVKKRKYKPFTTVQPELDFSNESNAIDHLK